MGRPPLPIGTPGSITVTQVGEGRFRARCRFRDYDGVTRPVERYGTSKTGARANLNKHLQERRHIDKAADITRDTLICEVARIWLAHIKEQVAAGERSPGTAELYEDVVDRVVLRAIGQQRVHEARVSVLDRLVKTVTKNNGPAAAKTCRGVLSGILGLAVRHGALEHNPVRDVADIVGGSPAPARALTLEEVGTLRGKLLANPQAVRRDVPDLVDFMLATGLRIGEACAVTWDSIDFTAGTVEVRGTLVREKGKGLWIKPKPKTKAGFRTLELPSWALSMLQLRFAVCETNQWGVVFVAPMGGLRDPKNTSNDLRKALDKDDGDVWPEFEWVSSHTFRKTVLTLMDLAGLPARAGADQAGHARVSMTQDRYFGRGRKDTGAARVLEAIVDLKPSD